MMAHPLLPSDAAVGNDVEVGPPGTFLFVTGSNMSGKEHAVARDRVNSVLAQMGGLGRRSEMRLPPVLVASSMRADSLDQGRVYFMAEFAPVEGIVDRRSDRGAQNTSAALPAGRKFYRAPAPVSAAWQPVR